MPPTRAPPAGRYRGESPPGIPEEWTIAHVAGHTSHHILDEGEGEAEPERRSCYVTGKSFRENRRHLRATLRRSTLGKYTPPDYRTILVADESALDEWLIDEAVPRMPPNQMDDELGW
ncbi:hypothetical protein BRD18_04235 [Halobacteriales archaeon SW_7_71_33]|nr:MAG: hypothetical protein BRD18_04235 [Halobacteriales archaeon SW_7_71_33]